MNAYLKLMMLVAVASACCFHALHAQDSRTVVLSNKVGAEIDKDERTTYRLFQRIQGFHSAAVRHSGDSSFAIVFLLDDGGGGFRDSLARVPYRDVAMLAENIDYAEALKQGRHVLGTGEVHLRYADGSPVVLPDPHADEAPTQISVLAAPAVREAPDSAQKAQPRQSKRGVDQIPLSSSKHGLHRPIFQSFSCALSMDYMIMDINEIESLPGKKGRAAMGLSAKVGIALVEDPSVRLMAGWTFFLDHDLTNYSLALLWQPFSFGDHGPLLGIGGGRIRFNFSDNGLDIQGGYTYPMLIVGWTTFHPKFDLLLSLPFGNVSTTFEEQRYTIAPAGPMVTLMVSL